jgi:hypothetical protein
MELGKKAERHYLICSIFTFEYPLFCLFSLTTFFVFYFELNHEIMGINCLKLNLIINDEYSQQNRVYHIARKVV